MSWKDCRPEIGFTYVSVDLEGYRAGSMSEGIKKTG